MIILRNLIKLQAVNTHSATSSKILMLALLGSIMSPYLYAQPQTLKYSYDALGRVKVLTDPTNGDRTYEYDNAGNRKKVIQGITPSISPIATIYNNPVTVSISTTAGSIVIRYTTNGTAVTSSSPVYTAPFTLAATATVKAKAYRTGGSENESGEASATYTLILPPPTPIGLAYSNDHGCRYISTWSASAGATSYIFSTTDGAQNTTTAPSFTPPGCSDLNTIKPKWVQACVSGNICSLKAYF